MFSLFRTVLSGELLMRLAGVVLLLVAANVGVWLWAFAALGSSPVLMGMALVAYSFGLRHAVDPDHIAAIDNVTRKLMQDGQKPLTVGLYFSLGHSSIVVLLSLAVATATAALQQNVESFRELGGVISTCVSAFFLFVIAGANSIILWDTWRNFRKVRRGEPVDDHVDFMPMGGGIFARIFRRLFAMIGKSWQMFPLGFLFGLGFDTASEVALLGMSATGASQGMSPFVIMVFPALFSAGMALIDTADGVLMLGAYGWAFLKPIRKLYYNLTITALSVAVAIVIGGLEVLGLLIDKLELHGGIWDGIATVDENFGLLGYGIIGLFVVGWIISLVVYRMSRLDEVEAAG